MTSLRNTRNVFAYLGEQRLRKNITPVPQAKGDRSAQITKIIPSIRMIVWLLYQYKSNLSNLFYAYKPFEPSREVPCVTAWDISFTMDPECFE